MDVSRRLLVSILFAILATGTAFGAVRPVLICFGDSITAGYGLPDGQSYCNFLDQRLHHSGYDYRVINRGASGATTKDAVAELPALLKLQPQVVIVEFGGNDGLRGLPLSQTRRNLDKVLASLQQAHVRILLAGITLPPNYGPEYIHAFESVFADLAAKYHTAFIPMIYKDLVNVPGAIQADGIHPTQKGSEVIANTLWPQLKPLLTKGH